jgi:hypothetical protein
MKELAMTRRSALNFLILNNERAAVTAGVVAVPDRQ